MGSRIAESLMSEDMKIWKRFKFQSGSNVYPWLGAPISNWTKYKNAVKKMLVSHGFSEKFKVPDRIRAELEDQNFHSLNQAIDFLKYGEGV